MTDAPATSGVNADLSMESPLEYAAWPGVLELPGHNGVDLSAIDRATILKQLWDGGSISVFASTFNMHAKVCLT